MCDSSRSKYSSLMQRIDSLEKTLMLEGIGGRRRRGRQRMRWVDGVTDCTWVWVNSRSSVMDREAWHAAIHGAAESDRTELNWRVYVNNRLSMITLYQCRFIHCNNVPTLVGVSIVGKIVYVWKYGLYEKSLYFSIQFCNFPVVVARLTVWDLHAHLWKWPKKMLVKVKR